MKNAFNFSSLVAGLIVLTCLHARGQSLVADVPETDGFVTVLGISTDDVIYAGGVFDNLRQLENSGLLIDVNGTVDQQYHVAGTILASVPDGSGGFYAGGSFTCMQSGTNIVEHSRIIKINSNGTVDAAFDPPAINGTVRALLLLGSDLYIGGDFTTVDGTTRNHLARLDSDDGDLDAGFSIAVTGGTSPTVHALEVNSGGTRLYVGGLFTTVGSSSRSNIAEINLTTSAVDASYNTGTNGAVRAIRITGNDNNLYIGGDFTTVGTKTRNRIAKVGTDDGVASSWNANADGTVHDIELITDGIITCGAFDNIGGAARKKVAKLRSDNGNAKSGFVITFAVTGTVRAIAGDGSGNWFVGGDFDVFDGVSRHALALVDGSGDVMSWAPVVADQTHTISFDPGTANSDVFCGGFNENEVISLGMGRMSGTTHKAIGMEIEVVNGSPSAMAFRDVSGTPKRLAVGPVLQVLDGNLAGRSFFAEWNNGGNLTNAQVMPNVNGSFSGLALNGTNAIVGGSFSSIDRYSGGSYYDSFNRTNLFEMDLSTSPVTITTLDPSPNGAVTDVVVDGGIAYVAGSFTTIGGSSRAGLAAIDLSDGSITAWDPNPNGTVSTILVDAANGRIYLGGSFSAVGGANRSNIACVDDANGTAVASWNPGTNGDVSALALDNGVVYAGGTFTTAGGSTRNRAAAFDADDGTLSSWNPDCNSTVLALLVVDDIVFMGGLFSTVSGCPRDGLAGLTAATDLSKRRVPGIAVDASSGSALQVVPNPVTRSADVTFTAPNSAAARLSLHTLDGREAATLFDGAAESGRAYSVRLDRAALAPGTYLLRLTCGGSQTIERVTVMK